MQNLDLSKPRALFNPLLPGKRVMAIIGFCDIHHFDFIVRRLGTEVCVYGCCAEKAVGGRSRSHRLKGMHVLSLFLSLSSEAHMRCTPIPHYKAMAFVNQVAAIVHENTSVRFVCMSYPPFHI